MKVGSLGLLLVGVVFLAFLTTGCRSGGSTGEVKIVRNGGPFDNKNIKDCLRPAQKSKYIGANSSTHAYPADGVQRYFTVTTDPNEQGDYQGVVEAQSADGFNIHMEGTFYFETKFACDEGSEGRRLLEAFDKQFGVRKFPVPGGGEQKAPWQGDDGWGAFLNAIMLPLVKNEFRVGLLKFTCDELVSSCALVAQRGEDQPTIDKGKAKKTGVNLEKVQQEIGTGFAAELKRTLGEQYFKNIYFRMSQPKLDKDIQTKINQALGSFAAVSQANALVQQAEKQAQALRNVASLYKNNPALVELEKWRIICGVSASTSNEKSPGCKNMTILAGTESSILLGKGK